MSDPWNHSLPLEIGEGFRVPYIFLAMYVVADGGQLPSPSRDFLGLPSPRRAAASL